MSTPWQQTSTPKVSTLRPYTGEIGLLDLPDREFFWQRYELDYSVSDQFIKVHPASQRYILPIFSPEAAVRGHVLRVPWSGSPRRRSGDKDQHLYMTKADTFMSKHEPVQSFYRSHDGHVLVAVEDQLSAIKLASAGYDSVALLGTPWSKDLHGYQGADRIAEIAHVAGDRELIVALDADATDAAFEFARKWRYAFKKLRVAILTKDLKDTKMADFKEVLGV